MRLQELQARLQEIEKKGFIRSLRKGSTGVGFTFEKEFGLQENNIPIADIGGRVEIKTTRKNSQSLITLFTIDRNVWQISQKEFLMEYGYKDRKGRIAIKNTMFYGKDSLHKLKLKLDWQEQHVYLVDVITDKMLARWDMYEIVGKFITKMPRLIMILAERKVENDMEYFHYNEAYLLTDPSSRKFLEAFEKSIIAIDIRMHLRKNGRVRNRGTALRIRENDLIALYEKKIRIL